MITAKEAINTTFESEMFSDKHYLEILDRVDDEISKSAKLGYSCTCIDAQALYPFRNRVKDKLKENGFKVHVVDSDPINPAYIIIDWL